ncbi:MAG: cytochrome c, partial [Nevskia sp.]|nr:cytochrome c [Nevskia sp.]
MGGAWADESAAAPSATPAATPATAPAAAADPKLAAKGEEIFRHTCSHCHGFHMMNPGPGVFDLRTFPHDDKARFVHSVTNGKNAMPSWKEKLQPDDIEA